LKQPAIGHFGSMLDSPRRFSSTMQIVPLLSYDEQKFSYSNPSVCPAIADGEQEIYVKKTNGQIQPSVFIQT
jgi:hypothetical protein